MGTGISDADAHQTIFFLIIWNSVFDCCDLEYQPLKKSLCPLDLSRFQLSKMLQKGRPNNEDNKRKTQRTSPKHQEQELFHLSILSSSYRVGGSYKRLVSFLNP